MDQQHEPPDPPDFLNIVGWSFFGGVAAALAWWSYQAFTWLKTGKILDWSFVTILHRTYPRSVGLDQLDLWAACSSNPSSAVPGCTGSPPWAGFGKLVDWWLTLDPGFGLIVTAVALGIGFGALICSIWIFIPSGVAGWRWLRPYLAPVLDPLVSGWQRWVQPSLDALDSLFAAFLDSRLGTALVFIIFGAMCFRGCFGG